jgi:hypothetical protein
MVTELAIALRPVPRARGSISGVPQIRQGPAAGAAGQSGQTTID